MYERFLELMQRKGVKFADVAKATGIHPSTFSDWKKGKSKPKTDKMQKIADYFGVSVDYLLGVQSSGQEGYYTNPETARVAQEIFENDELRALFDVQKDLSAEDLRAIHQMALALKRKERHE